MNKHTYYEEINGDIYCVSNGDRCRMSIAKRKSEFPLSQISTSIALNDAYLRGRKDKAEEIRNVIGTD